MSAPRFVASVPPRVRLFGLMTPMVVLVAITLLLLAPNLSMYWSGEDSRPPDVAALGGSSGR